MYGHKKPIFDNIKRQDFIIALGSIKNENTQMIFLLTIFRFGPADNNYQQISYHKINDNHYVLMYKIIITYFKYTHGFIYNIIIKHRYLQEHHKYSTNISSGDMGILHFAQAELSVRLFTVEQATINRNMSVTSLTNTNVSSTNQTK